MLYAPFTLLLFLLLLGLLVVFIVLAAMRVLVYAYRKVGVRPRYAFAVMLLSLLGSHVNIPLYSIPAHAAGVSLLLAFRTAPPVAYVSGSMGALNGLGNYVCSAEDRGLLGL